MTPERPIRRVLVTGGAGFIGSHLVDFLLERGDRVTVLDDLSTGRHANLAAARQRHGAALRVVEGSVAERLDPSLGTFDLIFHLAAAVGELMAAFASARWPLPMETPLNALIFAPSRYGLGFAPKLYLKFFQLSPD